MTMETTHTLVQGHAALLVSMPHIGTEIPPDLHCQYLPRAWDVEDTDWHLQRLYDFLPGLGASVLTPRFSRYVIDLNRPPDDTPMYPGASNTELCPTRFFTGEALYQEARVPDAAECRRRKAMYWQPYHAALEGELRRLRELHGYVLLWDAHSIRSEIPWLFEGRLPDLNIGTASGSSADASITAALVQACSVYPHVSTAVNGRFKGGYITRHYGRPANGFHAVQLEMCQSLYMHEVAPFSYDQEKSSRIQPLLMKMVADALSACASSYE